MIQKATGLMLVAFIFLIETIKMYDKYLNHTPIMVNEVINGLIEQNIKTDKILYFIDATFGRGGHTKAMLDKLPQNAKIMVIDKDTQAIEYALELEKADSRLSVFHGSFSHIPQFISKAWGKDVLIDGVLMDLGVSSPQLDDGERGFSFAKDGNLDMRMNRNSPKSAETLINEISIQDLTKIIREYGEEKLSFPIAKLIAKEREKNLITSTIQLANLIYNFYPKKLIKPGIHPATKTFQAIRIAVNDELDDLKQALDRTFSCLKPQDAYLSHGGKIAIISFHSLEDRIVKHFVKGKIMPPKLPKRIPITQDFLPNARWIQELTTPSESEINANPRSRSAKLRIFERLI